MYRLSPWMWGVGVSLGLLAAAPVSADEGSFMIGIGANIANEQFDGTDFTGAFGNPRSLDVNNSRTWSAQAGYRLNDYFAFELEYERIDEFDLADSESLFGIQADVDGSVDGWLASLNARAYPFERIAGLRPYLLVGAGYMELDSDATASVSFRGESLSSSGSQDEHAAVLQAGLGFDVQVTENWFVELEGSYKFPQRELEDFRFFTIGGQLQYRF
jgi:outer membrane protein W